MRRDTDHGAADDDVSDLGGQDGRCDGWQGAGGPTAGYRALPTSGDDGRQAVAAPSNRRGLVLVAARTACDQDAEDRGTDAPIKGAGRLPRPGLPTGADGAPPTRTATARVLVVDDHPINQKVAVRMLHRLGYAADVASNGLEALAMIADRAFAAVLMDCQMPEMDGFEATRQIRRWEAEHTRAGWGNAVQENAEPEGPGHIRRGAGRRLPIIAVTATITLADRARCIEAGMDDFLAKPVRRAELERTLAHWLPTPAGSPDTDREF